MCISFHLRLGSSEVRWHARRMVLTRLIQVSSTGIDIQFHLSRAIIISMQLFRIAHLKKQIKQDIKLAGNLFVRQGEEEEVEVVEVEQVYARERTQDSDINLYLLCAVSIHIVSSRHY